MFTSRLPKSTSARRPSNPNDGFTSLIGSNIPVSVKKANLFTPQAKRSLPGGLNSTSRKSYMTTDKKYQRPSKPAPDRDEQNRMFENFVEYLRNNGANFPIPEAKRFFSSVSTTECSRIFEFLLSKIFDDDFKINRLEVDVPEALAAIDYPYIRSVTKSALVSITTRQAIVNLLVIFDWLVTYISQVEDAPAGGEKPILNCILADLHEPCRQIEQLFSGQHANSQVLNNEIENLRVERDRLYENAEEIVVLEGYEKAQMSDFQECSRFKAQMKDYFEEKEKDLASRIQRRVEAEAGLAVLQQEIHKVSPILEIDPEYDPALHSEDLARRLEKVKQDRNQLPSKTQDTKAMLESKHQQLDRLRAQIAQEKEEMSSNIKNKAQHLSCLKASEAESSEMNLKILRDSLEYNTNKVRVFLKNAQSNLKRWGEVAETVKANGKIARGLRNKLK